MLISIWMNIANRSPSLNVINVLLKRSTINANIALSTHEFTNRRCELAKRVRNAQTGSVFVLFSTGDLSYRAPEVMNRFKPKADTHYFSGLADHGNYFDQSLTSIKNADHSTVIEQISSCRPDQVVLIGTYSNDLVNRLESQHLNTSNFGVRDKITRECHHIRSSKSIAEIDCIRKACSGVSEELKAVLGGPLSYSSLSKNPHLAHEASIGAMIELSMRLQGFQSAYIPVVAGGNHANTLHYMDPYGEKIKNGSLVLVDVGCEYSQYCSDLSRTFPIDCQSPSRYSHYQSVLYDIVLETQHEIIEKVSTAAKPGYRKEGIFENKSISVSESYNRVRRQLCPHHVGHYLGLDVHDCSTYNGQIMSNSVITVEPGLYIESQADNEIRNEFRGIGIRIEDDILVTDKGVEVLTASCPKNRRDIEDLMRV
ncbi:hypothetical protein ACOME3_008136 [Neoechinorhynchus agilis]